VLLGLLRAIRPKFGLEPTRDAAWASHPKATSLDEVNGYYFRQRLGAAEPIGSRAGGVQLPVDSRPALRGIAVLWRPLGGRESPKSLATWLTNSRIFLPPLSSNSDSSSAENPSVAAPEDSSSRRSTDETAFLTALISRQVPSTRSSVADDPPATLGSRSSRVRCLARWSAELRSMTASACTSRPLRAIGTWVLAGV
jgi:hypothetical protein